MASQVNPLLITANISKALTIGGWMSEKELIWLATRANNPFIKKIVEFGSFHGRSTRALADNSNNGATIWAVDPWNGDYLDEAGQTMEQVDTYVMPYFLRNLKDHIDAGRVIPTRGFSYSFKLPHPVDMVFIDGDHRYNTVVKDINRAFGLLRTGGIICGHDYDHPTWPGVKKAVDEMVKNVQIVETIWWSIKF